MLLDELVQKGWGIGSGISLFIVGGITANIWWMSFSFMNYDGRAYGAIVAFFQGIWTRVPALEWFYRSNGAPDMIGFFTTLVVFLFVIYVEGMRVELPISHSHVQWIPRKDANQTPVRLQHPCDTRLRTIRKLPNGRTVRLEQMECSKRQQLAKLARDIPVLINRQPYPPQVD